MLEDASYSNVTATYRKHDKTRIRQGDILRDFELIEWRGFVDHNLKRVKLRLRCLPYIVLLTQDCDLGLDFIYRSQEKETQDKYLQSILACPAYFAEQLRKGTHLEDLGLQMESIKRPRWDNIKNNSDPRYHFLPPFESFGIPPLVVDFKHYYSLSRDMLYNVFGEYYRASLNELFREELSQRFSAFLSRVGVPEFK